MVLVLVVCAVWSVAQTQVADQFGAAHDYLASGVAGTIWNGIHNAGGATVMDTTTAGGELTITDADNVRWGWGVWNAPLLYVNAGTGDFEASAMAIIPAGEPGVNWWKSKLMVYALDENANGTPGHDLMALELVHPADFDRTAGVNWKDNAEVGGGQPGGEGNYGVPFRWMKVVRRGNSFQWYVRDRIDDGGDDPNLWTDYGFGPMVRNDLEDVDLVVGLSHEADAGGPSSGGWDNFNFIPAPAPPTVLLLACAGLLALYRRRK